MIYQHEYKGVPVEGNFVRLCADSDGIYDVMDHWKDFSIEKEEQADRKNCKLDPFQAISEIDAVDKSLIQETTLCYVEVSPNCLHLCHKVYLDDGRGYIIDVNDGTIR